MSNCTTTNWLNLIYTKIPPKVPRYCSPDRTAHQLKYSDFQKCHWHFTVTHQGFQQLQHFHHFQKKPSHNTTWFHAENTAPLNVPHNGSRCRHCSHREAQRHKASPFLLRTISQNEATHKYRGIVCMCTICVTICATGVIRKRTASYACTHPKMNTVICDTCDHFRYFPTNKCLTYSRYIRSDKRLTLWRLLQVECVGHKRKCSWEIIEEVLEVSWRSVAILPLRR